MESNKSVVAVWDKKAERDADKEKMKAEASCMFIIYL
jgi:hypothetical protein